MLRRLHIALTFAGIFVSLISVAQVINPTFNPQIFTHGRVYVVAQQSNGKIIVGGRFKKYNEVPANGLVRLNTDGSVDESFSAGTGATDGDLIDIAIQGDDKILLTGSFKGFNGSTHKKIVRLHPDGAVDESFMLAANLNDDDFQYMDNLVLLQNGDIITTRDASTEDGFYYELIKLHADGSQDNAFSARVKGSINDIKAWIDGKILVAGSFTECNGTAVGNFVRLKSDGTVDHTYGTGADGWIRHIAVQSTNKIILTGEMYNFNGTFVGGMVRLNQDDSIDPAFSGGGSRVEDIQIDALDNIYVGRGDGIDAIQKLDANNGIEIARYDSKAGRHILLQNNGKIVALGYLQSSDQVSIRLNTDFTLDNTFMVTTGPRDAGSIQESVTQSDGKIVLIGDFVTFDGHEQNGIVRLNPDLTVDETFSSGEGFKGEFYSVNFQALMCQSDDKLIINGQFDSYNGTKITNRFIRLNSNGELDDTFAGAHGLLPNNMILHKDQLYITSLYPPYLNRLRADGSIDDTFAPAIDDRVYQCIAQPNNKIVIFGQFTSVNGTSVTNLARLNPDGSLDDSFQYENTADHNIQSVTSLGDKILLTGSFRAASGGDNFVSFIALNPDGKQNTDFQAPSMNELIGIGKVVILKDNSILVETYDHRLERLLPFGKRDTGFTGILVDDLYYTQGVLPLTPSSFIYYVNPRTGATVVHVSVTPIPDPPAAPAIISIEPNLTGHAVINWQDNSNDETNFVIERAEGNGEFSVITAKAMDITSHTDLTIKSDREYRYRVGAINDYGIAYSQTENFTSGIVTGMEEMTMQQVYPNPSRGHFQVNFQNAAARSFRVVDMNGSAIKEFGTADREVTLDLSSHPAGIYCIQIKQGTSLQQIKVVKY